MTEIFAVEGKEIHLHKHDGTTSGAQRILRSAKPDVVFHLASFAPVSHGPDDIEPLIRSNILLGTQILEAMRPLDVTSFVCAATFWQHYRGDSYNPVNLYAATKQAFEDILFFYTESSSLRAIAMTLFDVYGPNDHRDKLFQQLRHAQETGTPLAMTPGEQLLDLVHVEDAVEAFCQAARIARAIPAGPSFQAYSVSSGHPVSLREVVRSYEMRSGKPVPLAWGARPYRDRQIMVPWSGTVLPGWKPRICLEDGIRQMLGQALKGA